MTITGFNESADCGWRNRPIADCMNFAHSQIYDGRSDECGMYFGLADIRYHVEVIISDDCIDCSGRNVFKYGFVN